MTKLMTIVDAPATTATVVRVTSADGAKTVLTLLLRADDAKFEPMAAGVSLRDDKVEEMTGRFRTSPMLATIFVQGIVQERGAGMLADDVKIEELSEAFPIMPIQADGYEKRDNRTGEVTTVPTSGSRTLH